MRSNFSLTKNASSHLFRWATSAMLCVCLMGTFAGCSNDRPALPTYSLDGLKRDLTSISQTGDGGSGLEGIRYAIDQLETEKYAGVDDLRKLDQQLEKAKTADRRKAIAADMLKVIETQVPAAK